MPTATFTTIYNVSPGIHSLDVQINGISVGETPGVQLTVPNPVLIKAEASGVDGSPWRVLIKINGENRPPLTGKIGTNNNDSRTYYV